GSFLASLRRSGTLAGNPIDTVRIRPCCRRRGLLDEIRRWARAVDSRRCIVVADGRLDLADPDLELFRGRARRLCPETLQQGLAMQDVGRGERHGYDAGSDSREIPLHGA